MAFIHPSCEIFAASEYKEVLLCIKLYKAYHWNRYFMLCDEDIFNISISILIISLRRFGYV